MRLGLRKTAGAALLGAGTLAACSGGGSGGGTGGGPSKGTSADLLAVGTVQGSAPLVVHGVEYATGGAEVVVDGGPAQPDDLRPGHVVEVHGRLGSDGDAVAHRVWLRSNAIGPVDWVDLEQGRLVVLGQSVRLDADTVAAGGLDLGTGAGLEVGAPLRVSGLVLPRGEIRATRLEPAGGAPGQQVVGTVGDVDVPNQLFAIGGLTVDYGHAVLELFGAGPLPGQNLVVTGTRRPDGILAAESVGLADHFPFFDAGTKVHLEGWVTAIDSAHELRVGGFPVRTDDATVYVSGTQADLVSGARVEIHGTLLHGQTLAERIAFRGHAETTETVAYPFSGFDRVSVAGPFQVTVAHDLDSEVLVTIDAADVTHLDVRQEGSELFVGLQEGSGPLQIETMEVAVCTPILRGVALTGATRATLHGFVEPTLEVDLAAAVHLRGEALVLDEVHARARAASTLWLGDAVGLDRAEVELETVSSATLGIATGGVLSGTVHGASSLYYYGTDVVVDVATDFLSTVTHLGPSPW